MPWVDPRDGARRGGTGLAVTVPGLAVVGVTGNLGAGAGAGEGDGTGAVAAGRTGCGRVGLGVGAAVGQAGVGAVALPLVAGVPSGVKADDGVVPGAVVPNSGARDGGLLTGGGPAFGGGATFTVVVGVSMSAVTFAAAVASGAPQTMHGPLRRLFTVLQLLHFQVGTAAMCRVILSAG
jgi:hypothetical protein